MSWGIVTFCGPRLRTTCALCPVFTRIFGGGLCRTIVSTGRLLKMRSSTFIPTPRPWRICWAGTAPLPTTSGMGTSRPCTAKRIAVSALKNATDDKMNSSSAIRKTHCRRSAIVIRWPPLPMRLARVAGDTEGVRTSICDVWKQDDHQKFVIGALHGKTNRVRPRLNFFEESGEESVGAMCSR